MTAALETVSEYVAAARILLQDKTVEYRYSDDELVLGLSLAMLEARRLRPDLFMGRSNSVPSYTITDMSDATAVVFDPQYRVALVYYMVGNAQLRDEEDTQDQRSAALLAKFTSQLMSGA